MYRLERENFPTGCGVRELGLCVSNLRRMAAMQDYASAKEQRHVSVFFVTISSQ